MKLSGRGFLPRISGRPTRNVVEIEVPSRLFVNLSRRGIVYHSDLTARTRVARGDPLGVADANGGTIYLPSPAAGVVAEVSESRVVIEPDGGSADQPSDRYIPLKPQFANTEQIRNAFSIGGIWPYIWSSATDGMPMLDGSEIPSRCIVHFVNVEPFRARGRVFLTREWDDIMEGIRFFPRVMEDYGKVEVILTEVKDPVARRMYEELSGQAWTRLHAVPLRYPVDDPKLIDSALRRSDKSLTKDSVIWSVDAQAIGQIGRLLAKGEPPSRRMVTVGGPGCNAPQHYSAYIGTRLTDFPGEDLFPEGNMTLDGGLLRGEEIDAKKHAVRYDDDGFFVLPEADVRQTITFLRPGFDRASVFPAFAGQLFHRSDSHITATLRGEERPCISCGMCERLCPAGLLPQVMHRYLHRERIDEAVQVGLESCIDCNICTFVCPSKIELQKQFFDARQQVAEERRELEAAKGAEA